MSQYQPPRPVLERYRDWLINDVIPGFQKNGYQESERRAVIQLNQIEAKLHKLRFPGEPPRKK